MQYVPITSALTFEGSATIGYGNSYRDADGIGPNRTPIKVSGLPFFENFYAGGISDVRSFRDNTLGPFGTAVGCSTAFDSQYCRQPFGGNLKTVGSAEIIFPTPFVKDDTTTRLSWYLDVGNVFNEHNHSLGNINCSPAAPTSIASTVLHLRQRQLLVQRPARLHRLLAALAGAGRPDRDQHRPPDPQQAGRHRRNPAVQLRQHVLTPSRCSTR